MAYDNDFYQAYAEYLREPRVRQAHDLALGALAPQSNKVLDLGCGVFNEYWHYAKPQPAQYIGVDINAIPDAGYSFSTIPGDYRDINFLSEIKCDTKAFVSLFSTEITAPHTENYRFYERLFTELGFEEGLVSGFFYETKLDQNPVEEAGGIVSWQTLERLEEVESSVFSEVRLVVKVPSKLFGPDVYEVWKYFTRK